MTVIKSRRSGWAGHVERMGQKKNQTRFSWENQKGKEGFEAICLYGGQYQTGSQ